MHLHHGPGPGTLEPFFHLHQRTERERPGGSEENIEGVRECTESALVFRALPRCHCHLFSVQAQQGVFVRGGGGGAHAHLALARRHLSQEGEG